MLQSEEGPLLDSATGEPVAPSGEAVVFWDGKVNATAGKRGDAGHGR